MRNDANPQPDPDLPGPSYRDEARPATLPGRVLPAGASLLKVPALLALVAATSWVVGHWVSGWLVPIYLGVMGLILCPSAEATRRRRRTSGVTNPASPAPAPNPPAAPDSSATSSSDAPLDDVVPVGLPQPGEGIGPATATMKPKRSRSRTRKPSKPPAEPIEVVEATWVEVGPGKFVRVETPVPAAPVAGPHLAVEPAPEGTLVPDSANSEVADSPEAPVGPTGPADAAEPTVTPGSDVNPDLVEDTEPPVSDPFLELAQVADDAVAPSAVANDAPAGAAGGLLAFPVDDVDEGMFAPGLDLDAPTVDGTAPQVDGREDPVVEAEPPFADAETGLDCSPDDDACWPPDDATEPTGCVDFDPWDAPAATELDPTELSAPLDGEFASEAGPEPGDDRDPAVLIADSIQDYPLDEWEFADAAEADPESGIASWSGSDAVPAVPEASLVGRSDPQPLPLIKGVRRVEFRRGVGWSVPRGRADRPLRPARRPTRPHRPAGRRGGRPRQIIRTSPPRSPPGRCRWWWWC